jgi:hypothetical protein
LPVVALSSCPLVMLPSCLLAAPAGCCISSSLPLVAPPSRCQIAQAGCCVGSCRAAVLSPCHATCSSSHCPLTAPPSCFLIAPSGCCVASRCATRSLLSSSHCAALSSSCADWLLCCLSLHHPLVLLSRCPLVLSLCTG